MKQEAKLGVLSGMGRPTRRTPPRGPREVKPHRGKEITPHPLFWRWAKNGPMPVCSDRRQIYV